MAGKIALVMLQFEYLNRQKMASLAEFLERLEPFLAARPRAVPLAIECRNPNYLTDAYFAFLRRHDVHHVFCQGYYMPPVWELEEKFGEHLTAAVVIRLMGARPQGDRGQEQRRLEPGPRSQGRRAAAHHPHGAAAAQARQACLYQHQQPLRGLGAADGGKSQGLARRQALTAVPFERISPGSGGGYRSWAAMPAFLRRHSGRWIFCLPVPARHNRGRSRPPSQFAGRDRGPRSRPAKKYCCRSAKDPGPVSWR